MAVSLEALGGRDCFPSYNAGDSRLRKIHGVLGLDEGAEMASNREENQGGIVLQKLREESCQGRVGHGA